MTLPKEKRGFMGYSVRFSKYGFHPGLDKTGIMSPFKADLPPGHYGVPENKTCTYKCKERSYWTRQFESEEFSQHLGFRNAKMLNYKNFMKGHLGPGSHDINEALFKQEDSSPCKDQGFGKQVRFFKYEDAIPAPGTYHPETKKTSSDKSKTSFNRSPRFEDPVKPWSLGPNRYKVVDFGSMDTLIKKVVSKRGPYDLFTGPRVDTNIFNKTIVYRRCTPDKFYSHPTDIEHLFFHPSKNKTGKFLKAKRFPTKPTVRMMIMDVSTCYKNPDFPGPAQYKVDSHMIKQLPESDYAFGLTSPYVRDKPDNKISPGPGRYHIKTKMKCQAIKGPTSVFKSRTQRTQHKAPIYNAF